MGAERRNPRLLSRSIAGGVTGKRLGWTGEKSVPPPPSASFRRKWHPFLHCATPPAAPCAPHPSQGITAGCLTPRPHQQTAF